MPTRKPEPKPTPWHYLGGKKRRELGIVYAVDLARPRPRPLWVFKISEASRNRIVVEPE